MMRSLFLTLLLAWTPAMAEEAVPRAAPINPRFAIELLYAQPTESTNKRFADFQDTDFNGASSRNAEYSLRGRINTGDGAGLDGRVFGEFTYLESDIKRSYPSGNLHLQHRFMGINAGGGGTWNLTPLFAPYIEGSFLFPIKNEVQLSSGVGKVRYKSDFDDGSKHPLDTFYYCAAIGVDIRIDPSWLLILHYDYWRLGAGKAGGFHVGAGYAL